MMQPSANPGGTIMYKVGLAVLAVLLLYFAFMAVDGAGLASTATRATVTGKAYREAGRTYRTQVIGGRSYVQQQATPEAFLLELDVDGRATQAPVPRELFDALEPGDAVQIVYQRRRITGALQVVDVSR